MAHEWRSPSGVSFGAVISACEEGKIWERLFGLQWEMVTLGSSEPPRFVAFASLAERRMVEFMCRRLTTGMGGFDTGVPLVDQAARRCSHRWQEQLCSTWAGSLCKSSPT